MEKLNNFIAASIMIFTIVASAQTESPVVHDPVVAKQGDTFYLFCTGRGIGSYSSKDLKSWTKMPAIFDTKPEWTDAIVSDFKNHIWAPDVSYHNGQYFVYYSISAFAKNTSAIGVVTNKTIDPEDENYNWVDHGIVIESIPNRDMWNAIDPNLIFDANGTPWLSFGSFWEGLKIVKLNKDLLSIAQPQEWYTIAKRERSFGIDDKDPGDAALEAPFIFEKEGYYYLFLSWDLCCRGPESTYKVVVGRSKNVIGPYVDKSGKELNEGGGTLVIEGNKYWYGIGHNSVYTFDGVDYFFSHGYDAKDGAKPKLIVKQVEWVDGWPVLIPNN
ncbi:arabinan endo-1,5-alpha-L-arabinosidase [Gaetbulibacter sp. M240]|uniref:arabinan endo-1,5-alpha-L-arabinosidase n=1 Tax=Gaetbulibacter sp. M240 TaxID=3126511 RepID=UPI00374EE7B8